MKLCSGGVQAHGLFRERLRPTRQEHSTGPPGAEELEKVGWLLKARCLAGQVVDFRLCPRGLWLALTLSESSWSRPPSPCIQLVPKGGQLGGQLLQCSSSSWFSPCPSTFTACSLSKVLTVPHMDHCHGLPFSLSAWLSYPISSHPHPIHPPGSWQNVLFYPQIWSCHPTTQHSFILSQSLTRHNLFRLPGYGSCS